MWVVSLYTHFRGLCFYFFYKKGITGWGIRVLLWNLYWLTAFITTSAYTKFSENLTFLIPWYARKIFPYVLDGRPLILLNITSQLIFSQCCTFFQFNVYWNPAITIPKSLLLVCLFVNSSVRPSPLNFSLHLQKMCPLTT